MRRLRLGVSSGNRHLKLSNRLAQSGKNVHFELIELGSP